MFWGRESPKLSQTFSCGIFHGVTDKLKHGDWSIRSHMTLLVRNCKNMLFLDATLIFSSR